MKKKLLSVVMIVSISICAVACGSDKTSEKSTTATTIAEETTKETNVAETTEAVVEETTTAKDYGYPTTVEEAEAEFGFSVADADKFMTDYFANGNFMTEYPTSVLQHFDVNSDNIFDQAEFENIRNWTYLYYDSAIEGVSNNNELVDEIELMHIYNDYLTNGTFTFDSKYEDGSDVEDLSEYMYYKNLSVGRAKSDEEAAEMYDFTVEESDTMVSNWYNSLTLEKGVEIFAYNENIKNYFDSDKNGEISVDEFNKIDSWAGATYDFIGNNNGIFDNFEWMNYCNDIVNNNMIIFPYVLPNGEVWIE